MKIIRRAYFELNASISYFFSPLCDGDRADSMVRAARLLLANDNAEEFGALRRSSDCTTPTPDDFIDADRCRRNRVKTPTTPTPEDYADDADNDNDADINVCRRNDESTTPDSPMTSPTTPTPPEDYQWRVADFARRGFPVVVAERPPIAEVKARRREEPACGSRSSTPEALKRFFFCSKRWGEEGMV